MKKLYAAEIKILVGFEIDWIRPSSKAFIEDLLQKYQFDLFVGSVHHVHAIPIDYDHNLYAKACEISEGSEEKLAEDYFDSHYQMLQALKPPIVGHFDLIRLKSSEPNTSLTRWKRVWQKILRNLDYIAGYGGIIELSSAAVRKGLNAPYPEGEICKVSWAPRDTSRSAAEHKRRLSSQREGISLFPMTLTASIKWAHITVRF
jgi:histidinol-phosphatase (PHP family)